MTVWASRPREAAFLLNPGYCAAVLRLASDGYAKQDSAGMPFALAFLVLPTVLHGPTRNELPRSHRTSLAAWLEEHTILRVSAATRIQALVSVTQESILFGANHGLYSVASARITPATRRLKIPSAVRGATSETADVFKRAPWVGAWFAKAGSPATVLALWGVKP